MPLTILIDSAESTLSRSDRAAAEGAMGLSLGLEVHACCPSGNKRAIRYAMAAGAVKLVSLSQIESGLVICGSGGLGFDGELTAARIANRHQGRLVLDVLSFSKQGDQLKIVRKLDRGELEVLMMTLPAVLVMSESANTVRYLSRYRQAAISMPAVESGSSKIRTIEWESIRPRTKTADLDNKTGGGAQQRLFAAFGIDKVSVSKGDDGGEILNDPEECATQLVRYLAHHGFIVAKKNQLIPETNNTESQPPAAHCVQSDSESKPTSIRRTDEYCLSGLNQRAPRPLRMTPEDFRARRIRQPRSMDRISSSVPKRDQSTSKRFRRRPRPLDQSEPTNQRAPIPITKQTDPN